MLPVHGGRWLARCTVLHQDPFATGCDLYFSIYSAPYLLSLCTVAAGWQGALCPTRTHSQPVAICIFQCIQRLICLCCAHGSCLLARCIVLHRDPFATGCELYFSTYSAPYLLSLCAAAAGWQGALCSTRTHLQPVAICIFPCIQPLICLCCQCTVAAGWQGALCPTRTHSQPVAICIFLYIQPLICLACAR